MKTTLHLLGYGASVYLPILFMALLFALLPFSDAHNIFLTSAKVFWFVSALYVILNLIGFLYGSPYHREQRQAKRWLGWNHDKTLVVAYVSRGDNAVALGRAIEASRKILDRLDVNYVIETITDRPVDVKADRAIVVPDDYQTPHGAKYKARALHYATLVRPASIHSWVIHMDEESVLTESVIHGIHDFIYADGPLRIGQGEIKYNAHNYGNNMLITAIDSVRTGDDLGRFRVQYKLFGRPLFGMHGSFFVVNTKLEKKIGFDLGGKGSITEDAYFALVCASRGVRFEWVDGYIREQSPFTLIELLKQRRRWLVGLRLLVLDKTIDFKHRAMLGLSLTLSRVAWLSLVVTIWNVLVGGSLLPFWLAYSAALLSGSIVAVYMVGAYRNITDIDMNPLRQLYVWASAGVLVPVACIVEATAIIYSIVKPVKIFEVVNKN